MEGTESVAIDAPSSSAPPSSSTSSEPSSSATPQATTERPSIKTALEVFKEVEKQQRRPRTAKPNEITPSGEPAVADGTAAPVAAAPQGPVPTPVHIKAVENARLKGRTEAEQELAPIRSWADRAKRDPGGFTAGLIVEGLSDPAIAPRILQTLQQLGIAAPGAAASRGPTAAEAPKPDFQDGQGNQFYSAKAQEARDQWLIQKMKAEILGEVQPDLDQVRSDREQREQAQADQARSRQIQGHIAEARKSLPHFDKFKAEIRAAAEAMPLTDGHPASEAQVLNRAYWQVVGPKLSELEQGRVVADLKARAGASTLNPSSTGAPSGIPKNVAAKTGGTFKDALAWAQTQTAGR